MKRVKTIALSMIVTSIIVVLFLYAKDGRLSVDVLKADFLQALQLKKDRVEERLNYNPITYDKVIEQLKNKGLVVGDVEELGSNSLGAKIAVKFTVSGQYIYFYIIDWEDETNEDIIKTKTSIDETGEVYINGKMYKVLVNSTAMIARYEDNPASKIIEEQFMKIIPLTYDEMIEQRNSYSSNPAVRTIDTITSNIEQSK